jgi:sugar phosphate isomerase/epimerase
MAAIPLLANPLVARTFTDVTANINSVQTGRERIKISLNAYSFNEELRAGRMSLDDLLTYCAHLDFDAVDLTAYYFPGYPELPDNEYLNHIKKKAFLLGLDVSGSGVKNDFTDPDSTKRQQDITLIKNWTDVAVRLGAPVLRVFAGRQIPSNYTRRQISEWIIKDLKECVYYAADKGVIIGIQNHNHFLKTAEQTLEIIQEVSSPWFGIVLDIGSLRSADPYEEIAALAPYAVNWQIKEYVYRNSRQESTDVKKIVEILKEIDYRGYIPIETLGPGNPRKKVKGFLEKVREALG